MTRNVSESSKFTRRASFAYSIFLLMLLNIFNPNRNIYDIKRDKIWGLEIFLRYLF